METVSRTLLTFLLNALWQVPLAWAVAALACRLMPNGLFRGCNYAETQAHVIRIRSDQMVEFEEIEDEGACYAFQVGDRIVFVAELAFPH